MNENEIGQQVVDAAIAVHRELGPGLLETVYEVVLLVEIRKRGLAAERQVPVAIICRGVRFDEGFRVMRDALKILKNCWLRRSRGSGTALDIGHFDHCEGLSPAPRVT